jgi:RNA polymerase sigma factor for flagellar operon FliA
MQNLPQVKSLARHLRRRLPPCVEIDELVSEGVIGLMNAADKFDASRGIKFSTYAKYRINGAMLDYLRDIDYAPRSVRAGGRKIQIATETLETKLGRAADQDEIADEMNISLDRYHELSGNLSRAQLKNFETETDDAEDATADALDLLADPVENRPDNQLERREMSQCLSAAIDRLPELQRLILSLYYCDDLTMKEIGRVLGVGEARISQLHKASVLALRRKMNA